MKIDRSNIIIALLIILMVGLLFQNRNLNQRLNDLEEQIDYAISASEDARNFAEEASQNAFGTWCNECPD